MLYPNLRHLRLLKACGQEGGIGRAAERVGLSQPAASQALSRLESFYQCVLLERGRDRIRPTPDAARVLARGDRAFDYVRTACREAAARGKGGGAQSADRLAERVTIAQLRALQSLAEAGSFAGAARLLEQSDTAVQRAVRSAEEVLGAPLLREGARAAVLSPAGQIVARCFGLALRELDSARRVARLRSRSPCEPSSPSGMPVVANIGRGGRGGGGKDAGARESAGGTVWHGYSMVAMA
jgi:LysR family transcriptional regulator, regulator for genes of the gallate degradation pathway